MRILALIVARAGSKRLPGKNLRMLGGKPLIMWTVELAKDIPSLCDILVSTDSPEIAAVCEKGGIKIPWLRPHDLATDNASSIDVAIHSLNWYEDCSGAVDGLLLLQPTSPFRSKEMVLRGIELFKEHRQTVLGVSNEHAHPMWMFKKDGEYITPFMTEHGLELRSQDLPLLYTINGSFYLISPTDLRKNKSFISKRIRPLLTNSFLEAVDIDTEWDFKIAELIAEKYYASK